MNWTNEDRDYLLKYKDAVDSDDVHFKEIIKSKLLEDRYIIHVLNNTSLEPDTEDDGTGFDAYFGTNIKPYYMIPDTQTETKNFICYEISYDEEARYNNTLKISQVVFYILCEQGNIVEAETGIARHDLLAALITDKFNWSNYLGTQIHCVSDTPSNVASKYAARTLIFETTTPNSIVNNNQVINRHIVRK